MAGMIHRHTRRVTYADCTVGDHVYYARYLDFLEEARGEFFRSLGMPFRSLQEQDTALPVIECALAYRAPARYDNELTVETWVAVMERVRLRFEYRVLKKDGELVLTGQTTHACTSAADKLKRLPQELSGRLAPFLAATGTPG